MSFFFDHFELEFTSRQHKPRTHKPTQPRKPRKHRIKFSKNSNTVILIPSRIDYEAAGIDLWYKTNDQLHAKLQVQDETKALMRLNPILTFSQAMSFLYQPKNDYVDSIRLDEMDELQALRILCVDSDILAKHSLSPDISLSLQKFNRYTITFEYKTSAKAALKSIGKFDELVENKFDLVLVNPNIGPNYLSLVKAIRAHCKDLVSEVLIGIIFNENQITEYDVINNRDCKVDFMWKTPIHSSVEMLPLVLSSRSINSRSRSRSSVSGMATTSTFIPIGAGENVSKVSLSNTTLNSLSTPLTKVTNGVTNGVHNGIHSGIHSGLEVLYEVKI